MTGESRIRNPALLGIGFMCLGMMMFSLNDAMGKWLLGSYGVGQLLLIRSFAALAVLAPAMWREGRALFFPPKPWLQLFRVALSTLEVGFFYWAVSYLPLAETTTFWLAVPIYVALLAVPLLGEHVSWRRWCAIAVGLTGVVVVLRPSGAGMLSLSGLAMLGAALCYAVSAISVRLLGRTDTTQAMVFWMLTLLSVFATALAWPEWRAVRSEHFLLLAGIGVSGAIGQYCVTEAFRDTPASVVAPLEYTALIWALALDWLLLHTFPAPVTLLGAGIIVASGLYLIRSEGRTA